MSDGGQGVTVRGGRAECEVNLGVRVVLVGCKSDALRPEEPPSDPLGPPGSGRARRGKEGPGVTEAEAAAAEYALRVLAMAHGAGDAAAAEPR